MSDHEEAIFDVEPTKVMEFRLLFSGQPADSQNYKQERQLLRDGRDLYECGRLRHWTEKSNGDNRIVVTDVMDVSHERVRARVTLRLLTDDPETITGMSCSCTRHEAPQCVHACAVCFRLFYRHRYMLRNPYTGRTVIPREASGIVERYMADTMGTWLSGDEDDLSALAKGLEIITGFDQWEQWIANRHTARLLGNCQPDVEETIDMDTQVWPKRDVPGLEETLPHGWFTMLEAAYERLGDSAGLAKVYAIYIAQGRLP